MTEVRSIDGISKGLYATREYKAGDLILVEEAPLISLRSASSKEHEAAFWAELQIDVKSETRSTKQATENQDLSFYDSITIPDTVDARLHVKFQLMVQAAVSYACQSLETTLNEHLLELYYPSMSSPLEEEKSIVQTSAQALEYLKEKAHGNKLKQLLEESPETILKVMLISCCNSFEGGRIYNITSRINHSCNPNAVVKIDSANLEAQKIIAAAPIEAGDEIFISYIGTMLYADRPTRQEILREAKYFTCNCSRCTIANDLAARIPCLRCHPRPAGQAQLDEDVQYDDEQTVKYMVQRVPGCYICKSCHTEFHKNDATTGKLLDTIQTVSGKVSEYVTSMVLLNRASSDKDDDESELVQQTLREQNLELASSFLGASHWATNLLLLMELTELLEQHHSSLLDTTNETDATDHMETIAQGIDMLERLIRFVDGLDLRLHRGHLVSDMVIGIARALVSLGDIKSQKYAVEWLDKLDDYVEHYESQGMLKVVDALRVAWKRGDDDDQKPASKKLKV